jgi:DNA-binding response OmpR family regulator
MPDAASRRISVLVVEHDDASAARVAAALVAAGHDVRHARDAATAEAMLAASRPDLIALDLALPDVDGLVLCSRLRTLASVPILIYGAALRPWDAVLALRLGADDFVAQPFDGDEFAVRVSAVLERAARLGSSGRGPAVRPRRRRASGADQRRRIVLVVGDGAGARVELTGALAAAGYDPLAVPGGLSALAALGDAPPDLIVVDDQLAIYALLVAALRTRDLGQVPVLFLGQPPRPGAVPARAFVAKPFDSAAALTAVRRALAGRRPLRLPRPEGSTPP